MIGDSISRYQYLNLAYHVAYHKMPPFEFYIWKETKGDAQRVDNSKVWADWYNETNRILNSGKAAEVCDCYRETRKSTQLKQSAEVADAADGLAWMADSFENRYFTHQDQNISLTFLQWWDNVSFKGHWSPSMGYPVNQSCAPGMCGPPAYWEIAQASGMKDMLRLVMMLEPRPTHVVMNQGKWGHLSEGQLSDLMEEGRRIMHHTGTSFIWKTSTHDQGVFYDVSDKKSYKREISIARKHGWVVFDLYEFTKHFPSKHYNDHVHFREVTNSHFNRNMLDLILGQY
jgi:hypothetical protein